MGSSQSQPSAPASVPSSDAVVPAAMRADAGVSLPAEPQPAEPLPAWGADTSADGGENSDSDVEYDLRTAGAVTPCADAGHIMGHAATAARDRDDPSVPPWAVGGAADENCSSGLSLQFVYGTRGADCRRNVHFTASGEVAFHAAMLVVLYDPRRHAQRFLRGHDGEVRCLAVHPSGRVLASGQAAGGANEVCIWSLDAPEPSLVLAGTHPSGVLALDFSPSGDRLVTLGWHGAGSILALWDWATGRQLAASAVDGPPPHALAWAPDSAAFATVGVQSVQLWGVAAGEGLLTCRQAQVATPRPMDGGFDGPSERAARLARRQTHFLCCAYLCTGQLIAGTSRGEVWCWVGVSLCARFRAHDGPIFCLESERREGWLLSGGKDGRLRLWAPSLWPAAPGSSRPLSRSAAAAGRPSDDGAPSAPTPLRMVDLRKLAVALSDAAGRPRLLGAPRSSTTGARVPLPPSPHRVLSPAPLPAATHLTARHCSRDATRTARFAQARRACALSRGSAPISSFRHAPGSCSISTTRPRPTIPTSPSYCKATPRSPSPRLRRMPGEWRHRPRRSPRTPRCR